MSKASFILNKTNDGNDLSPDELWLVEASINGVLNQLGQQRLENLYTLVKDGDFVPVGRRPFHGIRHLTIASSGYVYWKGIRVEHYSQPWAYSDEGKKQAEQLANVCRELEKYGIEPGWNNCLFFNDIMAIARKIVEQMTVNEAMEIIKEVNSDG